MSGGRRTPLGPVLGAVGGLVLAVSLVLDWYEGVTGFTVFEALDLVLLALALAAVLELAGELSGRAPLAHAPRGRSLAIGGAAVVIVASQLINDPPIVALAGVDVDHATGIWLALGGAILMLAGALASTARISFAMDLDGGRRGSREDGDNGDTRPATRSTDPDAPTAVSDRPREE